MELKQFELTEDNLLDVVGGATNQYEGVEKASGLVYTVQRGDNLKKIAKGFGTTPEAILRLNRIADVKYSNHIICKDNKIQPGWVIRVK